MKTLEQLKTQALMQHLGIKENEVSQSVYNDELFEADGGEYLVLTDSEADEKAKEQILESVWAFNKSFLDCHSEAISELDEKSFSVIQEACEGANKAILAMIDDKERFINDAIACDGRGHFLSQYDGEENEVKIGEEYYFIYQTN